LIAALPPGNCAIAAMAKDDSQTYRPGVGQAPAFLLSPEAAAPQPLHRSMRFLIHDTMHKARNNRRFPLISLLISLRCTYAMQYF
jgi:hypothetical protein